MSHLNLQAFPSMPPMYSRDKDGSFIKETEGMTLRDYMAGQALVGIMGKTEFSGDWRHKAMADVCYVMADAMLKERNKS